VQEQEEAADGDQRDGGREQAVELVVEVQDRDRDADRAKRTAALLKEALGLDEHNVWGGSVLEEEPAEWMTYGELFALARRSDVPPEFLPRVHPRNQAVGDFLIHLSGLTEDVFAKAA